MMNMKWASYLVDYMDHIIPGRPHGPADEHIACLEELYCDIIRAMNEAPEVVIPTDMQHRIHNSMNAVL